MVRKKRFKPSRRPNTFTYFASAQKRARRTVTFTKRKSFKRSLKKRRVTRSRVETFVRALKRNPGFTRFQRLLMSQRPVLGSKGRRTFLRAARRLFAYARRNIVLRRTPSAYFLNSRRQRRSLRKRRVLARRRRRNSRTKKKLFGAHRYTFSVYRVPAFLRKQRRKRLWSTVLRRQRQRALAPHFRRHVKSFFFVRGALRLVRRRRKFHVRRLKKRRVIRQRHSRRLASRLRPKFWRFRVRQLRRLRFQLRIRRLRAHHRRARLSKRIRRHYFRLARRRYKHHLRLSLGRFFMKRFKPTSRTASSSRFGISTFRRARHVFFYRRLLGRLRTFRKRRVRQLYKRRRANPPLRFLHKFFKTPPSSVLILRRRMVLLRRKRFFAKRGFYPRKSGRKARKQPRPTKPHSPKAQLRRRTRRAPRALRFMRRRDIHIRRLARRLKRFTKARMRKLRKRYLKRRKLLKARQWLRPQFFKRVRFRYYRRKRRLGFPPLQRQLRRHYPLYHRLITFRNLRPSGFRRPLLGPNVAGRVRRAIFARWRRGTLGSRYYRLWSTPSFYRRVIVPKFTAPRRYVSRHRVTHLPFGHRLLPWLSPTKTTLSHHHRYLGLALARSRRFRRYRQVKLLLRIPKWRKRYLVRRRRRFPTNLFRRPYQYTVRERKRRARRFRSHITSSRFYDLAARYAHVRTALARPARARFRLRLRRERRLVFGWRRVVHRLLRRHYRRTRRLRRLRLKRHQAQRRYVNHLRFLVRKRRQWYNPASPKVGRRARSVIRIRRRRYGSLRRLFTQRTRRKRRFRKKLRRLRRKKYHRVKSLRRRWRYRWVKRRRVRIRKFPSRMSPLMHSRRVVVFYMRQVTNNFFYSVFFRRRLLATFSNGRTEFVGSRRTSAVACESAAKRLAITFAANKVRGIFFVFDSRFNYFKRAVLRIFRARRFAILGCKYHMRRAHGFKARKRASRRV
jgi:hypothetical protein